MSIKANYKKLLFLSLSTLSTVAVIAATSCGSKNIEKNKDLEKNSKTQNTPDNVNPIDPLKTQAISEVLEKINVKIERGNKDITVYNVNEKNIKFSNYNKDEYDVFVESISHDNKELDVMVKFYIVHKEWKIKSELRTYLEKGFAKENSLNQIFEHEWRKLVVTYPKKDEVSSKAANKSELNFEGYNKKLFSVEVVDIKPDEKIETTLTGFIKFIKNDTKEKSKNFSFEVKNFKPLKIYEDEKATKQASESLELDVLEKSKKVVATIKKEDIKIKNVDLKIFEVLINKIEIFETDFSLKADVSIRKKDSKFIIKKEFWIINFKNTGLSKEQIDKEISKVTFDYKNKKNLYVWNAKTFSDFVISNYNKKIIALAALDIKEDKENSSLIVTYIFKDIKTNSDSEKKYFTISGFKPSEDLKKEEKVLNEIAKKVMFNVKNKHTIELEKIGAHNITVFNDVPKGYKVKIYDQYSEGKFYDLHISFSISKIDDINNVESKEFKYKISGFKI